MNYLQKYLKYKHKYLELKKNFNQKGGEVIYDEDDIIDYVAGGEYSRFNIKTKEVQHWYAKEICNTVISHSTSLKNIKILVLGVALGGIIIHLLDKLKLAHVTGIDITGINFHIVQQYSPKDRLLLIEHDAEIFIKTTTETFDFIICDIFNDTNVPDFVLSEEFLKNIYKKLNANGKFLINTIGINTDKLKTSFIKAFPKCNISFSFESFVYKFINNFLSVNILTKVEC
jgi:spermidine synthase